MYQCVYSAVSDRNGNRKCQEPASPAARTTEPPAGAAARGGTEAGSAGLPAVQAGKAASLRKENEPEETLI